MCYRCCYWYAFAQDRMAEFGKRTKREARALAQGGKDGVEVC
jgi:hypothetical protein